MRMFTRHPLNLIIHLELLYLPYILIHFFLLSSFLNRSGQSFDRPIVSLEHAREALISIINFI